MTNRFRAGQHLHFLVLIMQ